MASNLQFLSFLEGENSNENPTASIQSVGKRPLNIIKSVVWDYFKKLSKEDDKAQCNICSESFKHSLNTSNLFKVFLNNIKSIIITKIVHECH